MMELYACGFNAWNQLLFDQDLEEEPHDLWLFRKVLKGETIDIWRAAVSSTLVETTSGLVLAGMPDELTRRMQANSNYKNFAEAGNGKIVASHDRETFTIQEFEAWTAYPHHPAGEWDIGKTKQLVAGRTTFTSLSVEGDVWTWGDLRYQACLGREVGGQGPGNGAAQPGLVTDLESLPTGPVKKIASGGSVTAALTAGHDLYLWGIDEFLHLDGQPTPLDIGDSDILDVGVGDSHVIILTSDRKVLLIGKGKNGQLGMGEGVEELREWREADLKLEAGWRPLQVAAGPRCSYVLVSDET